MIYGTEVCALPTITLFRNRPMQYIVLATFMLWGCGNVAGVHAAGEYERETLRGLPGVDVLIEDLDPDATAAGLSRDAIQADVELILRSSGIQVVPLGRVPVGPYLYLNVITVKNGLGVYAYSVSLELNQKVEVLSGTRKQVYAATWSKRTIGSVGRDNLHTIVSDNVAPLVKRFANDFLAVNPWK